MSLAVAAGFAAVAAQATSTLATAAVTDPALEGNSVQRNIQRCIEDIGRQCGEYAGVEDHPNLYEFLIDQCEDPYANQSAVDKIAHWTNKIVGYLARLKCYVSHGNFGYDDKQPCREVIDHCIETINEQDEHKQTPLLKAVEEKDYAAAKNITEFGAKINIGDDQGFVPLHMAAIKSEEIGLMLLGAGAYPYPETYSGYTALDLSVLNARRELTKELQEKQAYFKQVPVICDNVKKV